MDWNQLLCARRQQQKEAKPKQFSQFDLSEFDDDYLSIISSQAFRRLQDKTQVFPLDKSDFVRTRLTHSMEVSTIARQLARMIGQGTDFLRLDAFAGNPELVSQIATVAACAGLLHDTGNPPFGHYGEEVIRDWFKEKFRDGSFRFRGRPVGELLNSVDRRMTADFENFEGNAQGLRILSKSGLRETSHDVNLTYAVMNTLIKYPNPSTDFRKDDPDVKRHKMGYYYAERELMEDICTATGTKAADGTYLRHPIVFIMEAADDIAYAAADLADSVKKGRFTVREFVEFYVKEADRLMQELPDKALADLRRDVAAAPPAGDAAFCDKLRNYIALRARGVDLSLAPPEEQDGDERTRVDAARKAIAWEDGLKDFVAALDKRVYSARYARYQIRSLEKALDRMEDGSARQLGTGKSVLRKSLSHSDTPEIEFAIFENWLEDLRLWGMYCAMFSFNSNYGAIMAGEFTADILEGNNFTDTLRILKRAMSSYVYDAQELIALELSAKKIIESLLEDFIRAVMYADERDEREHMSTIDDRFVHMIPDNLRMDYLGAKERVEARVAAGSQSRESADAEELYLRFLMVTDYISGMTDSYARNLYRITNGLD
ncbi:MAG: dNTP triphosphohydrolase [Oscillospiraceae bacterium]|nr:dNTP triphosphohydrolase [Oscillospiraceae bacterium]